VLSCALLSRFSKKSPGRAVPSCCLVLPSCGVRGHLVDSDYGHSGLPYGEHEGAPVRERHDRSPLEIGFWYGWA
jgi:hypothetical protein